MSCLLLFVGTIGPTASAQDAPPIRPEADSQQTAGSTFWIDISVGTSSRPVENLFGTSFVLDYDASRVTVEADEAGSFLGSDVVYQSSVDSAAGEVDVGVSRKSGAGNVDGSGIVARVKVTVPDTVAGGTSLSFGLSEVSATDSSGASIALNSQSLNVDVQLAPPLRPTGDATVTEQDTFWVDVAAGSDSAPVENLFGTSFTLKYDAEHLAVVGDEAGSFLGSDVVYQSSVDSAAGEVDVGVSRKSGAGGVDGSGVVARVKMTVTSAIGGRTSLPFQLRDVTATDSSGASLVLDPGSFTITAERADTPSIRPTAPPRAGAKSSFWVDVQVGSDSIPVRDLFGTSFSLDYDESRVSVTDDKAGSLLGSDVVYSSNVDETAGKVGVGVSRKDGAGGVDGSGTAARVKVAVPDSVEGGTTLRFGLGEISANDPDGNAIALAPGSLVVSVPTVASAVVGGDGTVDFGGTGTSISFSGVSGGDSVTVEEYSDSPSGSAGIDRKNVSEYRIVIDAGSGLSFDSADVQLAVQDLAGVNNPENVTIYKRDSVGTGTFTALETSVDDNGTPDDISDDTLTASTDSFSEFALGSDTEPLPVEFASVEARMAGQAVRLSWTTASERNNAGFHVQRSGADQEEWTTVGRVSGAGTTTETQSYRYTDADLPYEADRLTYRLKQVDTDGTVHYSKTVTVERSVDRVELLGTYPNPARQQATVRYALPEKQDVTVRLYDVLGRQVRAVVSGKQKGRHELRLDVSSLSSGVYFLRLRAGGQVRTQKVTVVR